MFTNNKSGLNKVSALLPLGKADHDIIFAELDIRVPVCRKVLINKKAKWDD